MKAACVLLLAAIAVAGAARAADDDDLRWNAPSFETQKAKWAHDGAGNLIYGEVKLDCGVGPTGFAADCKVISAQPASDELTRAALALSGLYQVKESGFVRAVIDLDVRYDQEPDMDQEATRRQAPLVKVPPIKQAGAGWIECVAKTDGSLGACKVIRRLSSDPDYASIALALVQQLRIKPARRLGEPVESNVILPVSYGPPPTPATKP